MEITQKDFKDFLEKEGVYEKFKHNLDKYRGTSIRRFCLGTEDLYKWMMNAFVFNLTEEGHDFWEEVDRKWQEKINEIEGGDEYLFIQENTTPVPTPSEDKVEGLTEKIEEEKDEEIEPLIFKEGDFVTIKNKQWFEKNKNTMGIFPMKNGVIFNEKMTKYCGQTLIVKEVSPAKGGGYYYKLQDERGSEIKWTFTEEMFQNLKLDLKYEHQYGDVVQIKSMEWFHVVSDEDDDLVLSNSECLSSEDFEKIADKYAILGSGNEDGEYSLYVEEKRKLVRIEGLFTEEIFETVPFSTRSIVRKQYRTLSKHGILPGDEVKVTCTESCYSYLNNSLGICHFIDTNDDTYQILFHEKKEEYDNDIWWGKSDIELYREVL